MQYPVNHTCGHTVVHQIYGGSKNGNERSAWLATKPCLDCSRDAATNAAINANAAAGMSPLAGSEKQVAWAESIRAKAVADAERRVAELRAKLAAATVYGTEPMTDDLRATILTAVDAAADRALAAMRATGSATWWIDHRTDDAAMPVMVAIQTAARETLLATIGGN